MTTAYTPAQLACIEQHRGINVEFDWWDSTYDNFVEMMADFGIDVATTTERTTKDETYTRRQIYFSGFCSQGDGAQFATDSFTVSTLLAKGAEATRAPNPEDPEDTGGAYHFLYAQRDKPSAEQYHAGLAMLDMYEAVVKTFGVYQLSRETAALLDAAHIDVTLSSSRYTHSGAMEVSVSDADDELLEEASAPVRALCEALGETEWWEGLLRGIADALHKDLEAEHDYQTSDEAVWETIEANEMFEDDESEDDESTPAAAAA